MTLRPAILSLLAFAFLHAAKEPSLTAFDLETGESNLAALAKALPAMALADLSSVAGLRVVDRQNLREVLKELALGETGLTDPGTAPKVGNLAGAEVLLTGSLLPAGDGIQLVWKLLLTENGTVLDGGAVPGKSSDPVGWEKAWVRAVHEGLRKRNPGLGPLPTPAASRPDAASIERFGTALGAADRGEEAKALAILKELADKGPGFTYAARELGAVEKRLADLDKERERAISARTGKIATDWAGFLGGTGLLASSMKYSQLIRYVRAYRGDFPPAPASSTITAGEMGLYYEIMALAMLKRFDEALPLCESFLKAFPASLYGSSVKMYSSQAIQAAKTKEPKRKRILAEIAEQNAQFSATPTDRIYATYLAGLKWMGGEFHIEALSCFERIPLSSLKADWATDGDMILYNRFMCEYSLARKDAGLRTQKTLEKLYPESALIPAVASMATMFPE